MPKEFQRKRGRKHKKKAEEDAPQEINQDQYTSEPQAGPSWIVPASNNATTNQEAPFGFVDAEVKAYFRTVDTQIREWQEEGFHTAEVGEDTDPNEDRRLFFVAALNEMSGKERELATDPDCSGILERMSYSMDDFACRVFMDRLTGSFEQLVKHRFASHVCQTFFAIAADTVSRETRGILPPVPESADEGELRTLTRLVLDVCEELQPNLSSLIMDPFASHVVRALLALLCPHLYPQDLPNRSSHVRSKKSAAYKAKQGNLSSVFTGTDKKVQATSVPVDFIRAAGRFVTLLRESLDQNEVRALAANQVASPVLQMLLEIEADQRMHDSPGSLMDSVLAGLISALHEDASAVPEPSDFVGTLLRDPTSSHLLETLVARSPSGAFAILWTSYFKGKLPRLSVHPVANFVVAKALERVDEEQLSDACQEIEPVVPKLVKTSRTGVLRALIDRSATLHAREGEIMEVVFKAFDLTSAEDRKLLVPCVLRLLSLKEFQDASSQAKKESEESTEGQHQRRKKDTTTDPMEPKTQGAVLLQSLLRLPSPSNQPVLDSIQSLSVDDLLAMAFHVTSSRVLDAIFDSPTVPPKSKRTFVLRFIGHFHVLYDDRIGSRVGDRCWAFADPYFREKIARSVVPHENTLAGSSYGKYFTRNLNLRLLKRDPEEWKTFQAKAKFPDHQPPSTEDPKSHPDKMQGIEETGQPSIHQKHSSDQPSTVTTKKEKKRKIRVDNEIDELFDKAIGKKIKRAGLGDAEDQKGPKDNSGESESKGVRGLKKDKDKKRSKGGEAGDKVLEDVMTAIKSAPKDGDHKSKKRTKH